MEDAVFERRCGFFAEFCDALGARDGQGGEVLGTSVGCEREGVVAASAASREAYSRGPLRICRRYDTLESGIWDVTDTIV